MLWKESMVHEEGRGELVEYFCMENILRRMGGLSVAVGVSTVLIIVGLMILALNIACNFTEMPTGV